MARGVGRLRTVVLSLGLAAPAAAGGASLGAMPPPRPETRGPGWTWREDGQVVVRLADRPQPFRITIQP